MWLLSVLLILFIFLIVLVIISTSMKIGLIITNRHNYDSKLLIIPAILSMILWGIALFILYLNCQNMFTNGLEDMLLTIIMAPSSIENKNKLLITAGIIVAITVFLQSFTYYAINIDYQKMWGYIRFKTKQILKIKTKENVKNKKILLNEEKFNVPFHIAIITSILAFVISSLLVFGLYKLGIKLSQKIISL
ncbi:MAG: hypothetical protein Q4D02_07630 [Clostridia bacterium]|nr:hypothetical protein [Clostridia bacterium]